MEGTGQHPEVPVVIIGEDTGRVAGDEPRHGEGWENRLTDSGNNQYPLHALDGGVEVRADVPELPPALVPSPVARWLAQNFWLHPLLHDGQAVGVALGALQGPVPEVDAPPAGRAVGPGVEVLAVEVGHHHFGVARVLTQQLGCLLRRQDESLCGEYGPLERALLHARQAVGRAAHPAGRIERRGDPGHGATAEDWRTWPGAML